MGDILDPGYRTFKCPWKEHDIQCWISLDYNADKARTPIHSQCGPALQSSTPASPIPPPLFVCIPVPAIRVKLLAEAFKVVWSSKGLFNASHEDLLLLAGIEFVTWMGRSNIVYWSVPLRRKFWCIEIYAAISIAFVAGTAPDIRYNFPAYYQNLSVLRLQPSSPAKPNWHASLCCSVPAPLSRPDSRCRP